MGIAALAFIVMAVGSYFCQSTFAQGLCAVGTSPVKVTPFLLMLTYLILTVAELYISPLGISFVSKSGSSEIPGIMQRRMARCNCAW